MTETEVRIRDLPAHERREAFLDQLYAKLDDAELPAHVYARISSSITQLEKVSAQEKDEGKLAEVQSLSNALAALPEDHATDLLVAEIHRLHASADAYRAQLVELIGEEAAAEAVG